MLSNTLSTNEIKDKSGTEVEFERIETTARSTTFKASLEAPNAEHRLVISHQESGSSTDQVRRSVVRFDKTVTGVSLKPRTCSAYVVVSAPIGDIANYDDVKNVLAELMSFLATTGAATTVLFDCTGNGAKALTEGTL